MKQRFSNSGFLLLIAAALAFSALAALPGWGSPAETAPWVKMNNYATTDNLNAVDAASKKSVWFAGDNGTVLSWDGVNFKAYKVELPDTVRLTGIHMFSSRDGWAVGYNTANGYGRIYRFDGSAWKLFTSEGIRGVKFSGLAFLGTQDGLAVAEGGQFYRWDGRTWMDATRTVFSGASILADRVGLVSDVEADLEKKAYVISCRYVTHLDPPTLRDAYVRMALQAGGEGIVYNSPSLGGNSCGPDLSQRVFQVPGGKLQYLVGKTVYTVSSGATIWGKAGLREYKFNLNQGSLRGLWMFGRDDGWFVGDYGAVVHLQPGPRSQSYWPVGERLNAIWMNGQDFGFIAGDKGTVLMRNTAIGVVIDVNVDKLEYDRGEQVFAAVARVSQSSTAAMPLAGAAWEIRRETTMDERTTLSTVYSVSLTPRSRDDNQSLDPSEILTLQWNQKNSQGRQVEPGAYRAVFRIGDKTANVHFAIRAPSGPVTSSDLPDMHGGLALEAPDVQSLGDVVFRVTNHETHGVDLSGASYAVEVKRTDGWHGFYSSPERGTAFRPGTIATGKSYQWTWKRQDTSGKQLAGDGQYQVVLKMPGQSPDRLTRAFDIQTAALQRNK